MLLLLVTPAVPAETAPAFPVDRFLTTFYEAPDLDRVPDFLTAAAALRLAEGKNSRPPLIGFISELISLHPDHAIAWAKAIPESATAMRQLWIEASELSRKGGARTVRGHSPGINDLNWGAFFATGHADFVQRIIAGIAFADEREDRNLFLTGHTACWSLSSNARIHLKVRELLVAAKASATPRTRILIDQILTREPAAYRAEMVDIISRQRRLGRWLEAPAPEKK